MSEPVKVKQRNQDNPKDKEQSSLRTSSFGLFFWGQFILGTALILAIGYFIWPTLKTLVQDLANSETYSSAFIIPFVILYIVYRKRAELIHQPWQPSWWGLAVMVLGLGSYLFSELITIPYLSQVSCILVLAGVLFLFGGWRVVKTLSFPLFLLAIMVPLPQFFLSRMTLKMQLASSQLAASMLRLIGYPVFLLGNVLDLGGRKLQIVAACSGLGYLITSLVLGVIFCYFFQRRPWKVMILLLSMVPFAIVANASRLASIAIFPSLEKGFWHTAFGLSVFVVGFDYLKLMNWIVNRISPPSPMANEAPSLTEVAAPPAANSRLSYYPYLTAGLILVLLTGPLALRVLEVQPVPLRHSFDRFPLQLGPWEGRHVPVDPEMANATGADTFLNASFTNPDHGQVSLWIAYYENQKAGGSVHSPKTCLAGGGWKTEKSEVFELAPGMPIRFLLLSQGGKRMAMYYWYYERGRWLASDYWHKLSIGLDRLTSRRADGALVRLDTPVKGDVQKARERLDGFVEQLAPVLGEFIKE
jgi:exosortase D (VPLPA-CTERM-specific)